MAINLTKGQNINLSKEKPGLSNVTVGLGWDKNKFVGQQFDLDASATLIGANGKRVSDEHFVYFGNLSFKDGSVAHTGDNLTGEGDGDDEKIKVDLKAVPADVEKIAIAVSIYQAKDRGNQNFGSVENAFIRIVDDATGEELVHYDLDEDYSTESTVIFGELYRNNGDWKFKALGQGIVGEINELVAFYA